MKTLLSVGLLAAAAVPLLAENVRWPSWRGVGDLGSTPEGTYPARLDDDHLLWQSELPGKGCSTPIVWDDLIILTSPVGDQDAVITYDWKGKKVWEATIGTLRKGKHRNGSSSNPSAVTDGKSIFAYFKSGNLAALDLQGKVLWKTNLQERYGRDTLYWDIGTSPVLTRD
ncbi:MAG: PQQ-binding-like beta-propeller repeat protein, partial [Akkermansiaceae bacterium]|nr:PQQ-binding-like beta-propeller repeat protein [Akkermansiaceae bacterium]NIV25563.1 PQQ-binding-like beta-propeller repeat protein [Gemmatimonadota bacterium]NIW77647.1 PQQ-binding-like beta-propeller repeat protein [Gemmatimonadota bacterium]